jgi:anti-sigma B factor antagonist
VRDGNSTTPDEPTDGGTTSGGEPGAVQVIVGADATRIVLSGEVDADLGPELQEATEEAEQVGLPIEVDAHHVTFMDSSGVAFLARLSIRSQHRVRLLRVPPTVRFLLEVTRIGELLDVVEDDAPGFQTVRGDAATAGSPDPGPGAA